MLPSSLLNANHSSQLLLDLVTCIPSCWTICGKFGVASDSLFCTCTWATSGFVPGANVTVMVALPESSLVDDIYT